MYSPCHPHDFHRAALGFARPVTAEHPADTLFALVKIQLLKVNFIARIIARQLVAFTLFR